MRLMVSCSGLSMICLCWCLMVCGVDVVLVVVLLLWCVWFCIVCWWV